MATAQLLSHHSSNPLEVHTSDPQNALCQNILNEVRAMRNKDYMSSDDPLDGYHVEEYQHHVRNLNAGVVSATAKKAIPFKIQPRIQQKVVDIYSDSDDDLEIVSNGDEDDMRFCLEEEVADTEEVAQEDFDEDEENSLQFKPPDEQAEILEEIEDLEEAVPQLKEDYKIVDRLGTGTFSSVYKATDLHYHSKWHNRSWHGRHPPSSSAHYQSTSRPHGSKVFVAIKRIYVTSNPERIRNEISIMEDCLGCRHVAQLITAFRHKDQVVAVMPYHSNEDFRDYFRSLPMDGIKAYFRCLLRALRDIHARDIIHRDVKPANFLFDSRTYRGTLCDFGLASRIETYSSYGHCLHTPASKDYPHGRIRSKSTYDVEMVKQAQRDARQKSLAPSDRVGYPDKDLRPLSKANRAGTRGFRAPEVLLKCNEQTGAIDVWSAGMILLFFLTGKFPLFQSNDDIEALMEIAAIMGKKRMEMTATLHNRTFATNLPSVSQDGMSWPEFVKKNNPSIYASPSPPQSPSSSLSIQSESSPEGIIPSRKSSKYLDDLESALDLLNGLLEPDQTTRMTARKALYHPFLAEPDSPGDDAFFPHPVGEGRCGAYHFRDEVTEEHCVSRTGPYHDEVRRLNAGEGVPFGDEPCEFHQGLQEFHGDMIG